MQYMGGFRQGKYIWGLKSLYFATIFELQDNMNSMQVSRLRQD